MDVPELFLKQKDATRKGYAILFGMVEHEVHHRAQLLTYLRIFGVPQQAH